MKKIIYSIFAILLVFCFVGCSSNTEGALAKRISKNTNSLLEAINNLEEVTQSDIEINEFTNTMARSVTANYNDYTPYKINKITKVKNIFSKQNLSSVETLPMKGEYRPVVTDSIYKPRYVTNSSKESNYLDIFKSKIENLYNVCADCSYINNECKSCQNQLKTSINECKTLCQKLESGEIKLTEEQMSQCNTYCNQINACTKQIKNCKGDCNNYLNTLRALKGYFGSNTETLANNYLNLLGCLENRLCHYNEALECVNNCNALLKSCYNEKTNNNEVIDENKTPVIENTTQNTNTDSERPVRPIRPNPYPNNYYNNYPNGYNSNNGYYNNGFNNGYYQNPYNQTPNNVNTYGPINRNVDTYQNIENIEANKENRTVVEKEKSVENDYSQTKTKDIKDNKIDDKINQEQTVKQENRLSEEKFVKIEDVKKPLIFPKPIPRENEKIEEKQDLENQTKSVEENVDQTKKNGEILNKNVDGEEKAIENKKAQI